MRKFYLSVFILSFIGISTVFAQPATLDQSFGNKGMSVSDSARFDLYPRIALQDDGKILIATNGTNHSRGFIVRRYQKNGSLDSSFGVNGTATKFINPSWEYSTAITLQPDGKIIVGGSVSFNGNGQTQFVVMRFTSTGRIDSTFATNGVHILPIYNASDAICKLTDIILRPGGKILAGGHAANNLGVSYFAFEQLNQNGTLDSSFGVNGYFLNRVYSDADFNFAIDSSKKIIAGGMVSTYLNFAARRYKTNGTIDSSFGTNGASDIVQNFRTRDVIVEPDGKIVFYGQSLIGSDYRMTLIRFDSLGKLDTTFGSSGIVYKSFGGLGNSASALVRQPDGKYIIVGWSTKTFMIRYHHNGTVDSSFGRGGIVNTTFPGAQFINGDAALQQDGKVLLAGTAAIGGLGSYIVLTRYEKNAPIYYNTISGTVFLDKNSNGIRNADEPLFSSAKILTTKAGYDTITTIVSGNSFTVYTDTGKYTTTVRPYLPYYNSVPLTANTTHLNYYNTDSLSFAIQPIPGKRDLAIQLVPIDVARPGFPNKYILFYKNHGTDTAWGTIEFIKSNNLTFNSSVPAPVYVNGDTVRWNFSALQPLDTAALRISMVVKAPPVVNAGDTLKSVVSITSGAPDLTPVDNRSAITQVVRGSFDPNDKRESHGGKITTTHVASGDYLYYTIRFQNTGNDTAFNVYIRDTLSSKVDWSSFEMVASSAKYEVTINEGRCLFSFNDIKLVDSIKNEPLSHGYLVYRLKPMTNVVVGDVILNKAAIYFDYNLPVFTNNEMTTVVAEALPLHLLSFTATRKGRINLLQWNTANEINVAQFEIERSATARNFVAIGIVRAGGGLYDFKDENPLIGSNYYRLKIKDKDGAYVYSPVVVLNSNNGLTLGIYPNPVKEKLQLHINSDTKNTLLLQVLSLEGKLLQTKQFEVEGSQLKSLDVRKLKSGAYYLRVSDGRDVRVIRFAIML
jgi:uncharacterized delta-60 repeat protein/uncharacterized repeat protein (TIGR01451 family)